MYVAIKDMSTGNAETGEAWQETKIFSEDATLKEVMEWVMDKHDTYSRKRVVITKPHSESN